MASYKEKVPEGQILADEPGTEFLLAKAVFGERDKVAAAMTRDGAMSLLDLDPFWQNGFQDYHNFAQAIATALQESVMQPWTNNIESWAPQAEGGTDGTSWRKDLAASSASMADLLDAANAASLFTQPDFFDIADKIKTQGEMASKVIGLVGSTVDADLNQKSESLRSQLAITRGETLLMRLFQPDAAGMFTSEEKAVRVRATRRQVQMHAKWPNLYKPNSDLAIDALKQK